MRVCKRCLGKMTLAEDAYDNMIAYIKGIDEQIKTNEQVYEIRLFTCRSCKSLINGMCKHCGCFVEMRAAITKNKCPRNKW